MTYKLMEEYKKWGLEVNYKIEYMCTGGISQDFMLENDQQIKHCKTYKYLGMYIPTQNGTLDKAIHYKNSKARKAFANKQYPIGKISKNKKLIYNIQS